MMLQLSISEKNAQNLAVARCMSLFKSGKSFVHHIALVACTGGHIDGS